MYEQVELVEEGAAAATAGNGRGGDRRAHRHPNGGADPVAELANQQRQTQGLAVAADEMEGRRVLALEEHVQHRCAGLLDEAYHELPPWPLLRLSERVLRRRHGARRKDDDDAPLLEQPARLCPGREVGGERFFGL